MTTPADLTSNDEIAPAALACRADHQNLQTQMESID
jgi:hypothetical protein